MEMKNGEGFDSINRKFGDGVIMIQRNNAYSVVLHDSFVVVGGYKVKRDSGPFVSSIFSKHGDIVKECEFSKSMRWAALELVRYVYKRLELPPKMITPRHLKEVHLQLDDLKRANVDVAWLYEKLDSVYEAMETAHRDAKVVCQMCQMKFESAKMLHQAGVQQSLTVSHEVDKN